MNASPKTYRCSLEVRGYELDSYGHVNHAVYVSYLEHARWKLLAEEGIRLSDFNEWKRWPVIAGIEVKYLKPVFMGDVLEIRTQLVEHFRASFTFEQNVYKDELHVLSAKVKSVIINEKGRPSEFPEDLKRLWAHLPSDTTHAENKQEKP